MSAIALAPLTCYTHPNQQLSLLKYPNVCLGHTEVKAFWLCLHAFGNQTWLKNTLFNNRDWDGQMGYLAADRLVNWDLHMVAQ